MSRRPRFVGRLWQPRPSESLSGPAAPEDVHDLPPAEATDLRTRIAHLEQLVEGLQDSVYRESQRQEKRIAEIEKRMDPTTMSAALSQEARERGL